MAYLDLTTFTEVDPLGHWSQTITRNTGLNLTSSETSYVYKDYGVGYFGDFEQWFDIRKTGGGYSTYCFWSLDNNLNRYSSATSGLWLFMGENFGYQVLTLVQKAPTKYDSYSYLNMITTYYIKVKRIGTTISWAIYPTSLDRQNNTNAIYSNITTGWTSTAYRYLYAGASVPGASSGYTENILLVPLPVTITKTINSDSKIAYKKEILSDAHILTHVTKTIDSDAKIILVRVTKTIDSDSKIAYKKEILSDAQISGIETIISDAKIAYAKHITSDSKIAYKKEILSDSKIAYAKHITSDAKIKAVIDFIGRLQTYISTSKDFNTRLKIVHTPPSIPTNLLGDDLGTGEAVYLHWDDVSNYGYNVYMKVGLSWVKQNIDVEINTNYIVGDLIVGTPYTFMVRGVNGFEEESINSNEVIVTPTLQKEKIAVYKVYINSVWRTDAILKNIEIVYGPSFSNATFELLKPVTSSPTYNDRVRVTINNRQVFTGLIVTIDDSTTSTEQSISYTAICDLFQYTWNTVLRDYNSIEDQENNQKWYTTQISGHIGIPGTPINIYPGMVSIMDSTKLEAMVTLLGYCGNYKIYTDPYGNVGYYQMGTGANRSLTIGQQILEQTLRKDITNKVDQVTVYRTKADIENHSWYLNLAEDNKRIWVEGNKISSIIAEVLVHADPNVTYNGEIDIVPGHVGLTEWVSGSGETGPKHPVISVVEFSSDWQSMSVEVDYKDKNGAYVIIPEWIYNKKPTYLNFNAKFYDNVGTEYNVPVTILGNWTLEKAQVRIKWNTEKETSEHSQRGSGRVKRTLHDDNPLSDISFRAQCELDKGNIPTEGGEILILGDETMNLRTRVNGMDVTRVYHDFSSGFLTRISLTNEPFYRTPVGNVPLKKDVKNNERLIAAKSSITTILDDVDKWKALVGKIGIKETKEPDGGAASFSD